MTYVFDAGDIIHFHGRLYETGFEQPRGKRVPLKEASALNTSGARCEPPRPLLFLDLNNLF
jgi:hypothetical protein